MSNGLLKVDNLYFINPQTMMRDTFTAYLNRLWALYEDQPLEFMNDSNFHLIIKHLSVPDIQEPDLKTRQTRFVQIFNQVFHTNLSTMDLI